jgi:hypothetical protein
MLEQQRNNATTRTPGTPEAAVERSEHQTCNENGMTIRRMTSDV